MTTYNPDTDFNLENDAKEPGLIPDGTYHGMVNSVTVDEEKHVISWKVTLNGNGGKCSDDETEIDGSTLFFNNWLPKPGDKETRTASGRLTKFQSKVNQLKEFMNKMNLTQNTLAEIKEAALNGEYIGKEVDVIVYTDIYEGITSNKIKKMISV
jgi:hypothetical protein